MMRTRCCRRSSRSRAGLRVQQCVMIDADSVLLDAVIGLACIDRVSYKLRRTNVSQFKTSQWERRNEQDDPAGDGPENWRRPPVLSRDAIQGGLFVRRGHLPVQHGLAVRL